ncbi:MAG: peptidase S11 [Gammaproteobacteria bacterium]
MTKILYFSSFLILLFLSSVSTATTVFITKNQTPIYQENVPSYPVPIASITKLMAAIVILDSDMNLSRKYRITLEDVDRLKNSRSRLPVGSSLKGYHLLMVGLMSSDNRAMSALMRNYPGGYYKGVEQMNINAYRFGMTNTVFVDPTGLNPSNRSTPHDLAILVTRASDYKLIRKYTTMKSKVIRVGNRKLVYLNSNRLIRRGHWEKTVTSKTGFINEAGMCVVMEIDYNSDRFSVVVMNSNSSEGRFRVIEHLRRKHILPE